MKINVIDLTVKSITHHELGNEIIAAAIEVRTDPDKNSMNINTAMN